jgi:hypothetical protein
MPQIGATYGQTLLNDLITQGRVERSHHYCISMSEYVYNLYYIKPYYPDRVGFSNTEVLIYDPTLTGGIPPTISNSRPFYDHTNLHIHVVDKGVDIKHLNVNTIREAWEKKD